MYIQQHDRHALKDSVEDYCQAQQDDLVKNSATTKLSDWQNINQYTQGRHKNWHGSGALRSAWEIGSIPPPLLTVISPKNIQLNQ